MSIGTRKKIKIVSVAPAQEAATGLMKPNEVILFSGWADVVNPSSSRRFFIGQDSLLHTKFFKIRHNQALSADVNTRIIYGGKRYTVDSIEKDREKNFYWNIRATAQTDN